MKKLLLLILPLLAVTFAACEKDDSNNASGDVGLETLTINGTVGEINYWYSPDEVKKITVYANDRSVVLAEAPVSERKFTLTLSTPPDKALNHFMMYDLWMQMQISNEEVKFVKPDFITDKGTVWKMDGAETTEEYYMYVDGNVTIKGKVGYDGWTEDYSLTLKKGWNVIVIRYSDTGETHRNGKMRNDLLWLNP